MAVEFKDYYRILGVDRSADEKTIKSAYRKRARKYHPDVNKGQDARFKEIAEAYEVLSDPEKRRRYDTLGPDWQRYAQQGAPTGAGPGGFNVEYGDAGNFSEFFRTIFGDFAGSRGRGGGFEDLLGGGAGGAARTSRRASRSRWRRPSAGRASRSRSSWTSPAPRARAAATSAASRARPATAPAGSARVARSTCGFPPACARARRCASRARAAAAPAAAATSTWSSPSRRTRSSSARATTCT